MNIARPPAEITRIGITHVAASAILLAFLTFTSGWRTLLTLEFAAYLALTGGALVVYGMARTDLPFRRLAITWLPVGAPFLLIFLVLFGAGLAVAESGAVGVGIVLLISGYVALPSRSAFRFLEAVGRRNRTPSA
ncbi:MAG: hypothetical protein O3C10_05615 [Chloroflexi bacterium]|nr:hypothetical protein [Chloroflexota bacterium]